MAKSRHIANLWFSRWILGGKFNGPDGASPIHHCWLCNSWHRVDRSEFYINWQCPPEETLNGACQEILTPLASTSTSWTSWLGSWAFHNTCDYHWSPATGLLILKDVNALLGKMSISSLRNMSGSSLWSMLNMSISSSSKDVVLPLGSQLNTEERTSRRKKVAKTICKVCKNILLFNQGTQSTSFCYISMFSGCQNRWNLLL